MTALDWIIVALTLARGGRGLLPGLRGRCRDARRLRRRPGRGRARRPPCSRPGSQSPYAPLFGLAGALVGGLSVRLGARGGWGTGSAGGVRLPGARRWSTGLAGAVLAAPWRSGSCGSPARWRCRHPGRAACATTSSARHPARAQRRCCRRRARSSTRSRASTPSRGSTARPPRSPAPRAAIARDPQVRAAARGVVQVLGTACGLGIEGSGWVAARRRWSSPTRTSSPARDDTTVQLRRVDGPGLRRTPSPSTPTTTSRSCASTGLRAPRAAPGRATPQRRAGAILGFPQNGPYDVARRPPGRHATRDHPGRLRPRAGAAQDRDLARLVRPGNSGGPLVDARGRVRGDGVRRDARGARRGGYGVPDAIVGARPAAGPAAAGGDGARAPPDATLPAPWARPSSSPRSRPSGQDLARVLPGPFEKHTGGGDKTARWLEGPEHIITWAVGHLVQLAEPDEYDDKFKKWRMADLPIVPATLQARRARRALGEADDGRARPAGPRRRRPRRQRLRRRARGRADLRLPLREREGRRSPSSGCGCTR